MSLPGPRVGWIAGGLILLVLAAWHLTPRLVLNLGALYWRDVSLDLPVERATVAVPREVHVPWVVREMPFVSSSSVSVEGIWLIARTARVLEYRGVSTRAIGCSWNPWACTDDGTGIRLSAAGHAALAQAYANGRVRAGTSIEAELIAWSCLTYAARSGDMTTAERCRARLDGDHADVAAALSATGVVFGEYVGELNDAAGARLGRAITSGTLDCRGGLSFLRRWIDRGGFQPAQFAASHSLAGACPDMAEAHFYLARAADVSGRPDEAAAAYARSEPERHPEAAFWQLDFATRRGAGRAGARPVASPADSPALSQTFEAATLPARFENGTAMPPDMLVIDANAAHAKARRASKYGTILGYGPYVRLPYGRYRVSFFVRADSDSSSARIARLDVREDSDSWRSYLWRQVLLGRDVDGPSYRQFDHEFTSTGEGTFSIAVVTLTNAPVFFDRIELRSLGRDR